MLVFIIMIVAKQLLHDLSELFIPFIVPNFV